MPGIFRDFCIWATIAITVWSGISYVQRTVAVYRKGMAQRCDG